MSDPEPSTMPPDSTQGASGRPASDAPPTLAGGERPTTPPTAQAGRAFGRYTLLEEIGRGGMGVVWKALDTQLQRVVALKQVLPGGAASPQDLERFLREARLAARLRHPHIVPVYDAGAFEGQPYYTADFIEGRPLSDLVKRPLAPHEVARIMQSIAEALAYAHAQGVVHRDVKPGNILVAPDGQAWLTDFGLAKQLRGDDAPVQADLTVKGAILGTPHYMSPEQASGAGDIGPASDQFSLAVVMYEALTGRRPFAGTSPFEVACEVVSREPDPPRSVKPQIHPDLETICLRCLEKRPERRYPSADEFAADLARHLRGEPIEARPVSTIVRLARRVRANRSTILSALTLVLVLGIAAYALSQRARGRDDLAAALSAGREAKARGNARDARAAFERARVLDNGCAEAREGVAWADAEMERAQTEGMRKSALVAAVVSRWVALKDVLIQIQRVALDPALDPAARRASAERHWADIERFMKATPDDPASRATMLAFAGWAKILAGDRECGVGWMDEARTLDPEIPYGAGMKATSRLLQFAFEDIRDLMKEGGGVAFLAERARVRAEIAPLLEEARRARVWGGDLADQVETMLKVIDLLAIGKLTEAEKLIGAVRVFPGMEAMTGHLSRLRGDIRRRVGDKPGAVEQYTDAIRANPYLAGVYSDRGWVKHELQDFKSAEEDFTQALALSPRDLHGLRGRGWARIALGEPKAAVEDFTTALEACPGDAQALRGRAWAKINLPDAKGAAEDFTKALEASPKDLESLSGRASARLALGDRKGAIEDYTASLAIRPKDAQTRLARARALGEEGDGKGAEADLALVVAETPQDLAAWNLLLTARQTLGDHPGVIAACDAILALDPENAAMYQARGFAKKQAGEIDAAIADYDRAIRLRPAYPEAFNNRGRARYAKQDLDGALADYEEAIRLKPDHVEAIGNRGRVKEVKGDVAGAIEDYDLALRIAPADWPHRAFLEKTRAEALQKR